MEFLYQYGLFLAKTLTLVIGIIVTLVAILSVIFKSKLKSEDGTLSLTHINKKLDEYRDYLQSETLPKNMLKHWLKSKKKQEKENCKKQSKEDSQKRLFVINFDGDVRASDVNTLREEISAILSVATEKDEVLVVLESAGGFVHSYGLAASQLSRIRQKNLHLTVAIDKVAASGGYLMACVANKIIAAPFAIVGSIGVVAQLPNFHRLLEKNNIDYELHTAGEYKRTLTMFGENTDKARAKFQAEIEETHDLFKDYISQNRSAINIQQVATGEHWHATQAISLHLVDELQTSDDFILAKAKEMQVFEVEYEIKQKLSEKLTSGILQACQTQFLKWFSKTQSILS
ncbi:MAG: protease SohB [Proteobacteria bacterium]|nr:protease SohB [Pseudomonadota bacterium]